MTAPGRMDRNRHQTVPAALRRWLWDRHLFLTLHFGRRPNHQEDHERDDYKVNDRIQELAIRDHWRRRGLCGGEAGVALAIEAEEQVLEVNMAERHPDGRHDDVVYHRSD